MKLEANSVLVNAARAGVHSKVAEAEQGHVSNLGH